MAKILVYNNDTDKMETYTLNESDNMPYANPGTLTVNEFRGSSKADTLWTDKRAMESFNVLREAWGKPIYVGFAFKRIYEGGHGRQSQHYAGVAFDTAQNLGNEERNQLRETAINTGVWTYVEPAFLTPTWVHVDKRQGPPACAAGYPIVKKGDKGVYVLVLQDALETLGFGTGLDGIFGANTETSVKNYQLSKGIRPDGLVGCETWKQLAQEARGKGR